MSPGGKIVMAENHTHQTPTGTRPFAGCSLYRNAVPTENPVTHTHIPCKSAQKSLLPSPTLTSLFQIRFLPTPNPDPPALFPPEHNTQPPPTHCRTFLMVTICCLSSLSECHPQEAGTSAWLVHQWILGAYNRIWSLEAGNGFVFFFFERLRSLYEGRESFLFLKGTLGLQFSHTVMN